MQHYDMWSLNKEQLQMLYNQEMGQLQKQLLGGIAWEETRTQREKVAEISTILYKKLNERHFPHPAEGKRRDS